MTFRQLIAGADRARASSSRASSPCSSCTGDAVIGFDQLEPLGELTIRWTAEHWSDDSLANLGADYGTETRRQLETDRRRARSPSTSSAASRRS